VYEQAYKEPAKAWRFKAETGTKIPDPSRTERYFFSRQIIMQFDIIPRLMRPLARPFWWDDEDWGAFTDSSGLTVYEDENNVTIEAAVPGVDVSDIEVTYERGMLWIRAAMKEEEEDKERKYYRRASRSFSYRLSIPESVDESNDPNVSCKNGIVTVTFSRVKKSEPRKLPIQS